MNKHSHIDNKVQKTLESLDGIQRAEPVPFFYTRLRARLEGEEKNIWETMGAFLVRPAVAIAGLLLIAGLNVFVLLEKTTIKSTGTDMVQNVPFTEDENILTAANSFDYENLEP